MKYYYRPIAQSDAARPATARSLAGGVLWFTQAERLHRTGSDGLVPISEIPERDLHRITKKRAPIAGVSVTGPRLMGILNVTPDSFSDGGLFATEDKALQQARALVSDGADILDIGGESTRPGAEFVNSAEEINRTRPIIAAVAKAITAPISIDTRKAEVAREALDAGAGIVNDISAMSFDPDMLPVVARAGVPVCLVHAQGDPKTMQDNPSYTDVLLDVYDYLDRRIDVAEAAGIARGTIVIDPGIGFGKTMDHNLTLLKNISLFHGLGCSILLGASRKRFIGVLGDEPDPQRRFPGSVAVAMAAISQGVQIIRVHDMKETKQALSLWQAVTGTGTSAV